MLLANRALGVCLLVAALPILSAAPAFALNNQLPTAVLHGTVTDAAGAMIPGAEVVAEETATHRKTSDTTDGTGAFFFPALPFGTYSLTFSYDHFAPVTVANITLREGDDTELAPVILQPTSSKATVVVHANDYQLAEIELKIEEKQRILGVFPNFYVTYNPDAPALSAGQKFRLALRDIVDPTTITLDGITAGIEQATNSFSAYGQGSEGYAKRFGANYADEIISDMLAGAVLPSLLHQDPRYFYKGTGSVHSRLFYALATPFRCKGDNGRWQPNYSNIFGNLAASGISNLYYPAANRSDFNLTMENMAIGIASDAVSAVIQEFWLRKLTPSARKKKQQSGE